MSGHILTHHEVCELSHVFRLRCGLTSAAAEVFLQLSFHFHEGISWGGIGDAPLCKDTFWMPELASVHCEHHVLAGTGHLLECTHALLLSADFTPDSCGLCWQSTSKYLKILGLK